MILISSIMSDNEIIEDADNGGECLESTNLEEVAKPLVLALSKEQTIAGVKRLILDADQRLRRDPIKEVKVPIQGFENDARHPAMIKAAKKKYIEAIDAGLIGLLTMREFSEAASEVYCTAYAQAQFKSANRIRFKKIDRKHMRKTYERSIQVYLGLLAK